MEKRTESAKNISQSGEKFAWDYLIVFIMFLLLMANVLVLDYEVLMKRRNKPEQPAPAITDMPREEQPTSISGMIDESDENFMQAVGRKAPQVSGESIAAGNNCPQACLDEISRLTSKSAGINPGLKEVYITLGSGSTYSREWEEIDGLEAVIDLANYPQIKLIMFEASMRIPTANGRVYAKLYDVIEKHDAWNSEVYAEGSTSYRAESDNVTFSPGRKLYRVKMKSTMGYEAILDSARIKILLK